ncbi:hypothetical protein MHYP_G00288940 [Metynnis hypsauchen]
MHLQQRSYTQRRRAELSVKGTVQEKSNSTPTPNQPLRQTGAVSTVCFISFSAGATRLM